MPRKKTKTDTEKELAKEVKSLAKEIKKLKNLEFMKVFKHPVKFMWFSFLRGLMVGFGSVLGASVLVALFVFLIAQIKFVPIVGDFVENIMKEIESTQTITEEDDSFIEKYNEKIDEIETETSTEDSEVAPLETEEEPQLEEEPPSV